MSEISFKKNTILFLITITPFLMMLFITGEDGFTKLLPNQLFFQMSFIFWMSAVAAIIGGVFIGFVLAPVFLAAYKYTVGLRMTYGIQDRPKPTKLKVGFKALFPCLMAMNLALMFAQLESVQNLVLTDYRLTEDTSMIIMLTFVSILPLMMGISTGIFSPIWFLLDAGIVFTNKNKVKDLRDPIEVRSIGGWYHYILKGYSGIAIIVSYILFTNSLITDRGLDNGFFLIPLLPFLMIIMCIPSFIILEIVVEFRKKYMLKIAKKFNITQALEDPLDIR